MAVFGSILAMKKNWRQDCKVGTLKWALQTDSQTQGDGRAGRYGAACRAGGRRLCYAIRPHPGSRPLHALFSLLSTLRSLIRQVDVILWIFSTSSSQHFANHFTLVRNTACLMKIWVMLCVKYYYIKIFVLVWNEHLLIYKIQSFSLSFSET